ncbi:hypothetical protein B0H14DRAFT_3660117 [Mycena olivaceomarginata]|nr:hypothetical protein B0H14DRAFT_3660117 [Mycena olivaceomarginata]
MVDSKMSHTVWMAYVQGFQGWALEGIDGISGGQSLLFRTLDSFLGIRPWPTPEKERLHIPEAQRNWLNCLRDYDIRAVAKEREYTKVWRMGHMRRMQPYESQNRPERKTMTAGISVVDAPDGEQMILHLKKELGRRLAQTIPSVNGHITVNGAVVKRVGSSVPINQLGSRLGKLPLADNPLSRPSNTTPPPSSPREDAPETADLYFTYGPGKALLKNAISQSSVLGKDRLNDSAEEAHASSSNGPVLSFTCDAEGNRSGSEGYRCRREEAADAGEDDHTVDDDAEPEDDLNDLWEVLDLARAIYVQQTAQAITDYEAGLKLNDSLLPWSSRQIPEVHYNLSMVLDLMSGLAALATRSPTLRTRSKASSAH